MDEDNKIITRSTKEDEKKQKMKNLSCDIKNQVRFCINQGCAGQLDNKKH